MSGIARLHLQQGLRVAAENLGVVFGAQPYPRLADLRSHHDGPICILPYQTPSARFRSVNIIILAAPWANRRSRPYVRPAGGWAGLRRYSPQFPERAL